MTTRAARRLGLLLVILTFTALLAGPAAAVGRFTDDDGSVHEGFIEAVAEAGITLGCGPSTYCPGEPVERGQMASFLARALELPRGDRDYFADDEGSAHEDNINRVAAAEITAGDAQGRYNPDDDVDRGQMATFLGRALELDPGDSGGGPGDWPTRTRRALPPS